MSRKTEPFADVMASTLKRNEAKVRKTVKEAAKALVERKVERKSAEKTAKPASRRAAGSARSAVGAAASTPKQKPEDFRALFESDVQLRAEVERARDKAVTSEVKKRDRALARIKRAAADLPDSIDTALRFGLKPRQARTLDQLLGQFFGQPIKLARSAEVREAQKAANELLAALKEHWDAAIPKGKTRTTALKSVYDDLQAELKRAPSTNPGRFVREKLFDPWRIKFMKNLGDDSKLVQKLRDAGIEIVTDSGVPKFRLKLKIGKTERVLGFDVDHGETRLSDAVREPKRAEDLLPVVDSDGLQLLTPRENRIEIEALRKADREYLDKEVAAKLARTGPNAATVDDLNAYLDDVLNKLDKPSAQRDLF